MNRCLMFSKTLSALLLSLLVGTGSLTPLACIAQDQVRQFPAKALRGTLEVTAPPQVLLNGQAERLSPGARIKGPNNLLVLSASLVGQRVLVNYLRDAQNMVHEVWILNGSEAQEKRPGMET